MISLLLIVSCILQGKGLAFFDPQINKLNHKYCSKTLSFSWSGCGSLNDSIHIQSLSVLPDPIDIPGKIYLGTDFTVDTTESSPLPLSISVEKKVVWIWVTIPCEHGFGSCTYPDICQLVNKFKCPEVFKKYGIPCKCPLPRGIYSLPTSLVVDINKSILPPWLESGHYKARAHVSDKTSNEVLCIDLSLTVESKDKSINYSNNSVENYFS